MSLLILLASLSLAFCAPPMQRVVYQPPPQAQATASAPGTADPDLATLQAAEECLARKDWAGARAKLTGLLAAHPTAAVSPVARLRLALADVRLGRFEEAARLIRDAAPEERGRLDVLLLLSEAEEGARRPREAFAAAEEALRRAEAGATAKGCRERLKTLGRTLSGADVAALAATSRTGYAQGVLRFQQAQLAAKAGRPAEALALLASFKRDFPGHDLTEPAWLLMGQLDRGQVVSAAAPVRTIGVLVPQEGGFRAVGEQVLKGLSLATGVFGGGPPASPGAVRYRLAVRGLGKSGETAAEGLRQLAADESAEAVVALLGAAQAEKVGQAARRLRIPLLALCQDPRLPTGEFVFRNFLTPKAQVERLAALAKARGVSRLAILWPKDAYGREMAALMRAAAQRAGLKLAAESSYEPAQSNLEANIKTLQAAKRKPAEAGLPPFEAVFLPEGPLKAAVIIPQFTHAGRRGLLFLGPNLWNDARLAKGLEGTSCEVYCVDAFSAEAADPVVQRFVAGYRGAFGEEPGYLAAQAWDDARLIASAIEQGVRGREELARALAGTAEFAGVTGRTTFTGRGEAAKALTVLTLRQGRLVPAE
jgi:ABC-type branched-subunit amino acid transport system substrate-binding protein